MDKLEKMFQQQRQFIELLVEKRDHPEIPLDLSKKDSQLFLKNQSHECMHEMFEAIQHLKNAKVHRATDIPDFDRAAYTEELADVFHYLIGILICSDISVQELYQSYLSKGRVNIDRINGGY